MASSPAPTAATSGASSSASTRERLLDVAEALFAERGIGSTSLRKITSAAGVNLAAVHYHFGSKEGLLDAVIGRQAEPVNAARLAELERLEAAGAAAPPGVEALLAAFVLPAVGRMHELGPRAQHLARLIPRIEAQSPALVENLMRRHFGEVARRFVDALRSALPEHSAETLAERLRLVAGAMSHLFSGNFDLDVIPGYPPGPADVATRVTDALAFLAVGMRSPDPRRAAKKESP